ncbi:alpha-crystallin B chain-like isoform X2 [Schistocerca gregaria]|uniref:alpha-crystallin B chain-like isoform X2 n=1 Tax=Schistocerca gregaria TaxID=7010 RepID=UPI00211E81A7|nr:alpha-crystallin B chain-like isoform X2 [Schistocerca gregaria]
MSRRRVCYWPGHADRARDWLFLNLDLSDEDLNVARYSPTTVCYDPRRVASSTPDACCCSYYHQGPDACCCNYSRPWRYTAPIKSGFSKIERGKDGFKVTLDVKHFKEGDVKVKVVGNDVVVEAEHGERQDEHGYISRSLKRKYALPEDVDSDKVRTELSSDGILTITAPKKTDRLGRGSERLIPIIKVSRPALTSKKSGGKRATPGSSRTNVASDNDAGDDDDGDSD